MSISNRNKRNYRSKKSKKKERTNSNDLLLEARLLAILEIFWQRGMNEVARAILHAIVVYILIYKLFNFYYWLTI